MWNASYSAVLTHLRRGVWYGEANMDQGAAEQGQFDALSAFWPGLQA